MSSVALDPKRKSDLEMPIVPCARVRKEKEAQMQQRSAPHCKKVLGPLHDEGLLSSVKEIQGRMMVPVKSAIIRK